ncbi:MAG: hypothetical protein LBM41_02720, partial [Ruminococcus sp.]|nr:hypothetical protein [Ruminococcus sp.]
MFKRLISALLIMSLLSLTAVPVFAEEKTVTTRDGGYYYDEYTYSFTEDYYDYPDFIFGAGDYVYAVNYNRISDSKLYSYKIYEFDREAKLKKKYILPVDKGQRYLEFSCDKNGSVKIVVFMPYEEPKPGVSRLVGERVTYRLDDKILERLETEENFVYFDGNGNKTHDITGQFDEFFNAGETDIKSASVRDGSLYGTYADGKTAMLANKEVIEYNLTRDRNNYYRFVDLQRGDFAILYGSTLRIFRKTERKHPDLEEFYVGYTGVSQYDYQPFVNAYNETHDDYVAVPRYINEPLDTSSSRIDILITSQLDPLYISSKKNGHLADLYEFMGDGYFNEEKILMNLLRPSEIDGKLYNFSPLWEFDVMTANADMVKDGGFSSFDAMINIEKQLEGNEQLFSNKTNDSVFNVISEQYMTDYYNVETGAADINPSDLEALKSFANLYPTRAEYQASEDYDRSGFTNYFGYYEGGDYPPYDISQFDMGDYRNGRYKASVFTGITLPVDSDYEDEYYYNIFRNFSSYVNILYDGNFSLPGFWGKGLVKGTPTNLDTVSVSAYAVNEDGAKSFINFLLS